MATATLTPNAYRIRKSDFSGPIEVAALPMECGEDWNGIRRSMMRFAAPADFQGATIHTATLNWTVGYYSGFGESGLSILGIIANDTPFANQVFDPPMGTEQRLVMDENYFNAIPFHGMVVPSGTALAYDVTAMVAQAMAAGRFNSGEMQFLWTTNQFYSDYYQFTVGTPSLSLSYTPANLVLSSDAGIVNVGATITGTVTRNGSTSGDLVVTLTQSPAGRLTIPATVTILDGQSQQTFEILGANPGNVTLTATAGSDSSNRSLSVLPVGLGDEYLWICPSLDNEGNGTSTANDLSGNNSNGTLTDMDPATDWVTNTVAGGVRALAFDGSDRVLLGEVSANQWTFAVWVNVTSVGGAYKRIFGQTGFRIDIAHDPSGLLAVFAGAWHTFGSAVPTGTWVHYIVTFDGTSLRAYRNGSQIGATIASGRSMSGASRLGDYVSGPAGGDNNQFIGLKDDVRIFNRVINSAERTHLASARAVLGSPPSGPNTATLHHLRQMTVNS